MIYGYIHKTTENSINVMDLLTIQRIKLVNHVNKLISEEDLTNMEFKDGDVVFVTNSIGYNAVKSKVTNKNCKVKKLEA